MDNIYEIDEVKESVNMLLSKKSGNSNGFDDFGTFDEEDIFNERYPSNNEDDSLLPKNTDVSTQNTIEDSQVDFEIQNRIARSYLEYIFLREKPDLREINLNYNFLKGAGLQSNFFHFVRIDDDRLGFIIFDTGLNETTSPIIIALVKDIFENSIFNEGLESTSEISEYINKETLKVLSNTKVNVKAFLMLINTDLNSIQYTNAGYIKPLFYKQMLDVIEELNTAGKPFGLKENVEYGSYFINFEEGDKLFIGSPSLYKFSNPDGINFSPDKVKTFIFEHVRQSGSEFLEHLDIYIENYADGVRVNDDVFTVLFDIPYTHFDEDLEEEKTSSLESDGILEEDVELVADNEEDFKEHVETLISEGINLYQKGLTHDAISKFQEALRIDQDNFEANNYLGSIYRKLKLYEQAKEYYIEALAIDDTSVQVLGNLGAVYYYLKDYNAAKECWERSLNLEPNQNKIKANLAKLNKLLNT